MIILEKMKKIVLVFIVLITIASISSCKENVEDQNEVNVELETPDEISAINYEVYNDFLQARYSNDARLFFSQKTDGSVYWDVDMLLFEYQEVDSTTIISFEKLRSKNIFLNQDSLVNIATLISVTGDYEEQRSLLYSNYPEAKGLTRFTRIGFNKDSTQAIFGTSFRGENLPASDWNYLMEKGDDGWIVKWKSGIGTD